MTEKLKVLDLFSGLGGFSLGLERTGHFETVAFCDNDKFSKLILDKHWKGKKVYEDVREITKEKFKQTELNSRHHHRRVPVPTVLGRGQTKRNE